MSCQVTVFRVQVSTVHEDHGSFPPSVCCIESMGVQQLTKKIACAFLACGREWTKKVNWASLWQTLNGNTRNILLGDGPWAFHPLPPARAAGHRKREVLFQTQGEDKSEKEFFSVDQVCLRDANSKCDLELVRPRNLEVG